MEREIILTSGHFDFFPHRKGRGFAPVHQTPKKRKYEIELSLDDIGHNKMKWGQSIKLDDTIKEVKDDLSRPTRPNFDFVARGYIHRRYERSTLCLRDLKFYFVTPNKDLALWFKLCYSTVAK